MRALLTEARSPHVVLSLSFSYSGWFHGAQGLCAFTFLPGLLRPTREGAQGGAPSSIREGACGLREQSKSCLLAFCVNQGILASFLSSISLTAKFFPCLFLLLSILLIANAILPRESLDPIRAGPQYSPFTFIKRLFSSSSLSAISVVSSAYLRLLIFLPVIFIPAYASSSLELSGKLWLEVWNFQPCSSFSWEGLENELMFYYAYVMRPW